MRLIFRNFIRIFQHFRLAMSLNVLGLSVALVAFMLLMMQWIYGFEFDTHDPNAHSIYRIDIYSTSDNRGQIALMCRPVGEIIAQSSPHFKANVFVTSFITNQAFTIDEETPTTVLFNRCGVSEGMTKVFHFDMVEGDANALDIANSILVPESFARKWFPNESAVGKRLRTLQGSYTIGGVYKDFPENNTLKNYIYSSIGDENKGSYSNWAYNFYLLTDIPNNPDEVNRLVKESIQEMAKENKLASEFIAMQLSKIHISKPSLYDSTPRTSKQMMALLLSIAIIILLIATINFTNFSTAVSPLRVKNVNTQKVFGATTGSLRRSLLLESMLVGLFSFVIALMILWMLQDTAIVRLFKADTRIVSHPILVVITGIASVFIGLLAAIYPAYYTTSFQPAIALKGAFGISPKGKALRHLLISFQFIASFALIIAALFMYLQNRYAHTMSLGFDKEQLIVASMGTASNKCNVFEQQLKTHPEIEDMTFADIQLCNASNLYMNWGRSFKDQTVTYNVLEVAPSFPRVMGIKPYEGRDFREEDMNTRHGVYLFNETAAKLYDFKIGDAIDSTTIVGFVPNIVYNSLHMETPPTALLLWGKIKWGESNWDADGRAYSFSYIKTKAGADLHKAMEAVSSELKALSPDYPFEVRFFDTILDQLYKDDQQLTSIITLFSLLAVFISIMGIFGLVVFDSEYKRKEIGIRKVMGSTTLQILLLFNKGYIRTLVVCFCIAMPIAYYGVSSWLENFTYKIPIYWWVFPIAFLLVGGITMLTITYQSWHAANENPTNSLKSE